MLGALVVGYVTLAHRVTGASLAGSVYRQADAPKDHGTCTRRGTGWRCRIGNGSGFDRYRVVVDGHCWTAHGARGELHGCVNLLDQFLH